MPQDQFPGNSDNSHDDRDRTDPGTPARGDSAPSGGSSASGPSYTQPIHQQQPYGQQPNPQGQGPQQGPYGAPAQPYRAGQGSPYAAPGQGSPYAYQGGQGGSAVAPTPRRRSRSALYAVPIAAILAAALASGTTYALTDHNASTSASGTSTTTVKLNPTDYQNNDAVNWTSTASKVSPSVVSITVRAGSGGDQGSGVVLDKSGDIVTNNHVVSAAATSGTVQVTLSNNKTYAASIVGTDASTDLAVIRLKNAPNTLTPMPLGSAGALVVGQPVMAVGNPLGLAGTVTTGIVSALNRPVNTSESDSAQSNTPPVVTNAIQTSAAINPGNSGGALVSASGKLIGINSSIATLGQSSSSSQSGNIGIGFAIPVDVVKNITGQLLKSGKATHAQLGVMAADGTATLNGATEAAAQVKTVNSGSAAGRAGLKAGDYIIDVDGQQVASSDSLVGFVRARNVGQKVVLTIVRGGKQQNVTVTLGEASSS
ncbi:S1C family serine protease [Allobranchiibius sp. CTAmp26]|uniref:S1C family serine protease n=1 Tax=Allobranchiibius sp. CTAmp26 TaxID=2815214 RepID=UPI001AA0EC18|nr:trypsin-like peptidase domain-containing protein [Allobranchiibius sp. CTAmp26]MBO1753587.1 trypsin-like peptidase domain-containing protein [Allobranchiibius sp. CTAmp26]